MAGLRRRGAVRHRSGARREPPDPTGSILSGANTVCQSRSETPPRANRPGRVALALSFHVSYRGSARPVAAFGVSHRARPGTGGWRLQHASETLHKRNIPGALISDENDRSAISRDNDVPGVSIWLWWRRNAAGIGGLASQSQQRSARFSPGSAGRVHALANDVRTESRPDGPG